jgi:hypothetical protein
MRRTELLVSARKRRRCPEHLSPFATCHMRSWRGSGDPALLRSSWIRRKGRFSHSRVCCWIVSISFTRRFGRPPG